MSIFNRKKVQEINFPNPEITIAKVGDVVIINGVAYRVESERLRQMLIEPYYRSAISEAAQQEASNLREDSKRKG
ncbi:MAG TPA: hypothetical protein VNG51_19330 [Ktedonobacteraceae bacterium]|nr:hypothetical protein [Ktedonobacteraceae bacterium]